MCVYFFFNVPHLPKDSSGTCLEYFCDWMRGVCECEQVASCCVCIFLLSLTLSLSALFEELFSLFWESGPTWYVYQWHRWSPSTATLPV